MNKEMPSPEALFNSEKYSPRKIFEHLFPGNSFDDLPLINGTEEASVFIKMYLDSWGTRTLKFADHIEKGIQFAEREKLGRLDKFTSHFYFQDLVPNGHTIHPTYFNGTSFMDLVDTQKGERLAGVATRPIPWGRYRFIARWELKAGLNPYMKKPEIVLGVIDKNGKPAAIIHYIEGSNLKGKKVEVLKAIPSAQSESI